MLSSSVFIFFFFPLEVFLCKQGLCLSNSPRSAAFWYSREIINHYLWRLDMLPWKQLNYHKHNTEEYFPALAYWGCVGRTWFNTRSFESQFLLKMILRELMDSLFLNMSGLRKLSYKWVTFLQHFLWTDEKISPM